MRRPTSTAPVALMFVTLCAASCASQQVPPPVTPAGGPLAPAADRGTGGVPAAAVAEVQPEAVTPDADFRKAPPEPGPEPDFKVPAVKRFKLKNGLPVILAEAHDLPVVDVTLYVKSGAAANPRGLAGLSDMTANILDEGTMTRTALQIADDIAFLGASLGTGSTWDSSSIWVSALSRNVDQALAIWSDVLLHPRFDDKELARVRDNVVTGMSRRKDSPPAVAGITFARVLFGPDHPFGWPQSGVEDSVKRMTTADLRGFYESYYRPNNAVLVVAGDITEGALKEKMETALKTWRPKPIRSLRMPKTDPPSKTRIYLVDKAGAPQSSVRVGLLGLERASPDYFPAVIMNMILGGGFFRLDLNLREGKGWTYGARSGFEMRRAPGPFIASGEFVAAHTADAVSEILKEVKGMRDADVTDGELKKAKDQFIKGFPARFATRGSLAAQMAELALYGLPEGYFEDFTRKIAAVTKDDVRRIAGKYLQPDRLAIVVVGDLKSNEAALKKIADVELRDLDGKPIAKTADASSGAKP